MALSPSSECQVGEKSESVILTHQMRMIGNPTMKADIFAGIAVGEMRNGDQVPLSVEYFTDGPVQVLGHKGCTFLDLSQGRTRHEVKRAFGSDFDLSLIHIPSPRD